MADRRFLMERRKQLQVHTTLIKFLTYTVILLFILLSGCATSKTFRVLDAETREPIEGAVALATWTSYKGVPGLSYGYTSKAVEDVSDKNGYFTIPAFSGMDALDTPHLKIYKPGYVGWDSRWIYLGCYKRDRKIAREKRRENFKMQNQDIYLEHWKKEYSYISHRSFINPLASFGDDVGVKSTESKYLKAIRYEVPFAGKERDVLYQQRNKQHD